MGGVTVRNLRMLSGREPNRTEILRGIDFDVPEGAITGIAGESGSGKTMTGLSMIGLQPTNTTVTGEIEYDGENLVTMPAKRLSKLRGNSISMIFQDPSSSLHPMMRIETQLTDHLRYHQRLGKTEARRRAIEALEMVQVPEPAEALRKYPHQFSGGQLQRIAIATAIICRPKVLIADEPTTALDVTVQAGILRLVRQLCDDLGLAVVFVTHDLGVMSSIADTILVMKEGEIVESGGREQVITRPRHDYTKSLIESLPAAYVKGSNG